MQPGEPDSLPGFRKVLNRVPTAGGTTASLFERLTPPAYARVVPAAVKAPDEQATFDDTQARLNRIAAEIETDALRFERSAA